MAATGSGAGEGSEDDDVSTEGDEDESLLALFVPLSDAACFGNISNLCTLRLLFDVFERATPGPGRQQPAAGDRCDGEQHQLSGLRRLQETYDACGHTLPTPIGTDVNIISPRFVCS